MTSKATSETKLSDESRVSQLEKILKEQAERAEKERTELMAMLKQQADLLNKLTAAGNASGNPTTIMPVLSPEEILANTIHAKLGDFNYDPEAESTFDVWYRRYKSVLEEDGKLLPEENKVRVLCRRLSDAVFKRLVEITSPNEPEKTKYADLIRILDETFGSKATLFSKRYEVMRMAIRSGEDLIGYLDKVNAACDRIDYSSMEIGQFKALVFVSGLKTPECEEIRRRILHVLEAKPNAKLVDLRSECEAYQKLKTNVQVVMEERSFAAQKAKVENDQWKKHQAHESMQRNNGECYRCGRRGHHVRDCNLPSDIQCDYCGRLGHLQAACRQKKNQEQRVKGERTKQPFKAREDYRASTAYVRHATVDEKKEISVGTRIGFWNGNGQKTVYGTVISGYNDGSQVHYDVRDQDGRNWCVPEGNVMEVLESQGQMKKLSSTRDTKPKQVPVYINGKRCWLEGDSGASETIVSKWFWNNVLGKPTLQRTTETITDFSGNQVRLMGKLKCDFKVNGRKNQGVLYVTEGHTSSVLGRSWTDKVHLKWILKPKIKPQFKKKKERCCVVNNRSQL